MKPAINIGQQTLFSPSSLLSGKPVFDLPETMTDANHKGGVNHMTKFKPFHEFQKPLVGLSPEAFLDYIDSVIPKDDLCRFVKEVVFSLDTQSIEAKYSFKGQNSYHPKLMLSLLFYGYATGVRSSRKLEERCIKDHSYIYLMQCYTPDHRTISDFRKDNLEEIEKYFVEIVRIFSKLGVTEVGKIYIDGTKIKGNASAKRTKDAAGYEKWLADIREEITELLKEAQATDEREDASCKTDEKQESLRKKLSNREYLKEKIAEALEQMKGEDKKNINLTDPDANYMKAGGSKDIRPGYNCQASVTEDGLIVAVEAVTQANDQNQLQPMIEQSESNGNKKVKEAAADSGYGNHDNYEYLEGKGIDGYVPDLQFHQYKKGKFKEDRYHYSNFEYDEPKNGS